MTTNAPPAPDLLLTPKDLASRWHVTVGALANMRCRGDGPAYLKLGAKAVRYRWLDVVAFERSAVVNAA